MDSLLSLVEDQEKGDLADNYMANMSDDAPLPQTLPGIKLKRPFASLIKKYERLTGRKVPPDPDFPDEPQTRPSKRNPDAGGEREKTNAEAGEESSTSWMPVVVAIAAMAAILGIGRSVLRKRRQRGDG